MVDYSIVLIGFMGTGKTSIAKALSERLNMELIDTDECIVKRTNMTIPEIFEKYGEYSFRQIEHDTIKDLKDRKGTIISCGGGACLRNENISNMKENNKVILLEASPKVILERIIGDTDRPVLKGKMDIDNIENIMNIRKASYHRAADIIIDTVDKTILEIVDEIIEKLRLGVDD